MSTKREKKELLMKKVDEYVKENRSLYKEKVAQMGLSKEERKALKNSLKEKIEILEKKMDEILERDEIKEKTEQQFFDIIEKKASYSKKRKGEELDQTWFKSFSPPIKKTATELDREIKWYMNLRKEEFKDLQVKERLKKFVILLRSEAEGGDCKYKYLLGQCYTEGHGVEENANEAAKWIHEAAEGGYIKARAMLGAFYMDGYGVKQDIERGFRIYKCLADGGIEGMYYEVGLCYINGKGVEKNYKEAEKWFCKALNSGHEDDDDDDDDDDEDEEEKWPLELRLSNMYMGVPGIKIDHTKAMALRRHFHSSSPACEECKNMV